MTPARRPRESATQRRGTSGGRSRETNAERRERRASVTDVAQVLDAAARFLEARSRSVAEVRRRLVTAGYGPELVEEAVSRLIQQGYLDDDAFARAWVDSRDRARPRGERALRTELIQRGIAREIIDAVLAERSAPAHDRFATGPPGNGPAERESGSADEPGHSADEAAATRLIERNRRALLREDDPRKRRQRAYALLARNGFDPETCRTVAASVVNLDESDESEMPAAEGP
jgi:SOS response regulatory protein OraA/RecX